MKWRWLKHKGFSLMEILLVLAIISGLIVAGTEYMTQQAEQARIDSTAAQMQAILNAALAYYVANGHWPGADGVWESTGSGNASSLMPNYLPAERIVNPWGGVYLMGYFQTSTFQQTPPNQYIVGTQYNFGFFNPALAGKGAALAQEIASKLPNGYVVNIGVDQVYASVSIPTQTLNKAVNFGGVYHHGACVPVPSCPQVNGVNLTPQIFVVPISVSGVSDIQTAVPASNSQNLSYPITSFTAFASGSPAALPPACPNGTAAACTPTDGAAPPSGMYWRVCMQVVTQHGDVSQLRSDQWGNMVAMSAFTRCADPGESQGSSFSVFTK